MNWRSDKDDQQTDQAGFCEHGNEPSRSMTTCATVSLLWGTARLWVWYEVEVLLDWHSRTRISTKQVWR